MADPNVGQVTASVFEAMVGKGKPTNNVFNSRALLYALADPDGKGRARYTGYKEEVNGGRLFEYTLEYAENTNFAMYGEMDTLTTTRVDTFDAAQFNQKICAGTINISDLEVARKIGRASCRERVYVLV